MMSFFERLKADAAAEWRAYTEHSLTKGMADGSLPEAAFRHYLVQDYLFLIEFARTYALSVYKSPKLADMREGAAGLSAILDVEMDLHVKLCAGGACRPATSNKPPPRPRCWPIRAMCSTLACAAICWRSRWRLPPV
jgi:thiaminase/transcriptional activator TenA